MTDSIERHISAAGFSAAQVRALTAAFAVVQGDSKVKADLVQIATQFNQLRTDYNANAAIDTDTTASAITLTSTT
jgi:hypothetical protein